MKYGSMMSICSKRNWGSRMWAMFASEPVSRLSAQMTRWPRRRSSSHRCEPRKPAPPVTRQVGMGVEGSSLRPEGAVTPPFLQPAGSVRAMPATAFVDRLNDQIANEFGAQQQYVAIAVHYDAETLPRLAAFFYAQALEERNHAMMMVQYLVDQDVAATVPGVVAPQSEFDDVVSPVALALEQEKRVTQQINALAGVAREQGDYSSEQFMQWFIKEQIEEVATMSDLLRIVERARDNPLLAEEYLAREQLGGEGEDPTAPPVAGGAV